MSSYADVSATLGNEYGEIKSLGLPYSAKKTRKGFSYKFQISDQDHVSPFSYLLVHGGHRILNAFSISPISLEGVRFVTFVIN